MDIYIPTFFCYDNLLNKYVVGSSDAFLETSYCLLYCRNNTPALITLFFYKRLDYMESEDIAPPIFSGQKKVVMNFTPRSQNYFDEIMQRVDKNWIISYTDRENKVLKFRTDTRALSWGIGGYVKLLEDKKVLVIVYSMHPDSRREEKILNQTLRLMRAILNPR